MRLFSIKEYWILGFFGGMSLLFSLSSDVIPSDDFVMFYKSYAIDFPVRNDTDKSQLYRLYIRAISCIFSNPLSVFYFVYASTRVISLGLLFIFLKNFISPWGALLGAILLGCSLFFMDILPVVSIFALCIILTGICFALKSKDLSRKLVIISITLLIISYARPEFYVPFLGILLFYIGFCLKNKKQGIVKNLLLITCIHGVLIYMAGRIPYDSYGPFLAFSQHFGAYYGSKYIDISQCRDEFEIFDLYFGENIHSISDALKANPNAFFGHIANNGKNYVLSLLLAAQTILFPFLKLNHWAKMMVLIASLPLFLILLTHIRNTKNAFFEKIKAKSTDLLLLVVIVFPTIISTLLIYPRSHYLLFHFIVYLPVFSLFLSSLDFRNKIFRVVLKSISVLMLLVTFFTLSIKIHQTPTPLKDEIIFVQNLKVKKKMVALGEDFMLFFYGKNNIGIFGYDTSLSMKDFIQKKSINIIFLNENLLKVYKNNPSFIDFCTTKYSDFGFIKIEIPKSTESLLVHKSLL